MTSLLSAELAATCNALGYYDGATKKYFADGDTLETVKDLIRYLRRDDETHDIRRQLGNAKVLQTDLLPMLKSYWEETELFDVLLRLLVNLTTPAVTLWNDQIPSDKITRNYYMQVSDHLKYYKETFADQDIWSVLSRRLSKILEIDYAQRGDENSLIIERILILLRNVLYVPIEPYLERPDDDASIHDQVLWSLHQSGMLDIILYIASSQPEQAYYMHVIEILYFMLREQKASELAKAALQRSENEKVRDEAELLAMRHREACNKQQKMKKYTGARHSRFGGTYVVKSMKSISENNLIYHKPLNKLDELNFDMDKKKPRTPKNRMPVSETSIGRRSAFSIRLFLKEFCIEFLNGAYNTFMNYIKHALVRGHTQNNDESYYFWCLRFFMEINRCYKFDIKLVSETMSLQTFHYVQREIEKYFDMMFSDKKNVKTTSKRLHIALLAYRELFYTICAMDRSSDETVKSAAKVIKSNIFYVPEYREMLISLLHTYDELKSSDQYLNDLIETQHVFFKLLDKCCSNSGGVVVKRMMKQKKKRSAKKTSKNQFTNENLESQWDEIAPQITVILENAKDLTSDVPPFDAGSDMSIDDQKPIAMKNIQRNLRTCNFENAIGLLHAAREVWPENDDFGNTNMSKEEEFLALKDIFFASIDDGDTIPQNGNNPDDADDDEEEEYEEHEDMIDEQEYKVEDFVKRLANPKIVRACGLALKNFERNTINTNLCIVKLLHRIAFDCKMYVMLFQLSLFRTFQQIFKLKELPQHKELVKFAIYIIRQFFKVAETNKKVYIETLFWKNNREAFDIEEGYGSHQTNSSKNKVWTEENEDELRRLFMEHREQQIDEDVIDWIIDNLIDNTRTRRSVVQKLKEMMLITGSKPKSTSRAKKVWTEEEEAQLRDLFNQFKDAIDPMSCVMERMDVARSKKSVIEKLLEMGLIQDKKEVRKKRTKKSKNQNPQSEDGFDENNTDVDDCSENSGSENDMSEDRVSRLPRQKQQVKTQKELRKQKKNTTKRNGKRKENNQAEIISLLLAMNTEFEEALRWLKESFSDAIEDMNDTGDDENSLPLVPIMDYAVEAIENEQFQKLLKSMGIVEPLQGQEIYWRIPESISAQTLTQYIDILTQAIDRTLVAPQTHEPCEAHYVGNIVNETNQEMNSTSSTELDENKNGVKVPTLTIKKHSIPGNVNKTSNKTIFRSEEVDSDYENTTRDPNEDEDTINIVHTVKRIFHEKHSNLRFIDSESEDEIIEMQVPNNLKTDHLENGTCKIGNDQIEDEEIGSSIVSKKRSRKIIDSSSEDEHTFKTSSGDEKNKENNISAENGENSAKKQLSKRKKIIDSDDD